MNFKLFLFYLIFFNVSASSFAAKKLGQLPEVSFNDDELLKRSIEKAHNEKKELVLEENRIYNISKPLKITCSIEGKNATIIANMDDVSAISISENNISIKNLKIGGERFKMLDVEADNIVLDNCKITTVSYFVLVRIAGNNCSILNSELINNFKGRHQYAIKNKDKSSVNKLGIKGNKIYGGIYLENEFPKLVGGYVIDNNTINIDYSHVNQNLYKQHDGFHFAGIKGIDIVHNTIKFKNVNRGFKLTDYQPKNKNKKVSAFPTTEVTIKDNDIESNSVNGKQLFDLYDGTAIINIVNNKIRSIGHTTLFEDKTAFGLPDLRQLSIIGNKIYFDFRVLYYRGAKDGQKLSKDVNLIIRDNDFYFTPTYENKSMKRVGSKLDFKMDYLLFIRTISNFEFENNKFHSMDLPNPFKSTYLLYVYEVEKVKIDNNKMNGGILYQRKDKDSFLFSNNIVDDISLSSLVEVRGKIKKTSGIKIYGNTIIHSDSKFKLLNISSNTVFSNNDVKKKK